MDKIIIRGAREHNLKNINLEIPKNSFVVFSGVSGSGKSSLAFDTIFQEGQRRYMESLSSYSRQFLGNMKKPDVDSIEGLSPAISIDQKTVSHNPRSTVGTITEIYDYYRLLYARIGKPFDPITGEKIEKQSLDHIVEDILKREDGTRAVIYSPIVKGEKGTHKQKISSLIKNTFLRARIDGVEYSLKDDKIELNKNVAHNIEVVIDRIFIKDSNASRIFEAIENAINMSEGQVLVKFIFQDKREEEKFYSTSYLIKSSNTSFPEIEPKMFSFNSPFGACPECHGLGIALAFDEELVIDYKKSIREGGIKTHLFRGSWIISILEGIANAYKFSLDTKIEDLPRETLDAILHGKGDKIKVLYKSEKEESVFTYERSYEFQGILNDLERKYKETESENVREYLKSFMSEKLCPECNGARLKRESLSVKINGLNINELCIKNIKHNHEFFSNLELVGEEKIIAEQILIEIKSRLEFLLNVGLHYLTLMRESRTLSGGESQRIRLATQIGSGLTGVLYVLDEPSIGLHQRDNDKLIETLKKLKNLGNTLIVVEHDEDIIKNSDFLVDVGLYAGKNGGQIITALPIEEALKTDKSLTVRYLRGLENIPKNNHKRKGNGKFIKIMGAKENNLKNINVTIPLGQFVLVTGVSGSGKSSLIQGILSPALSNYLYHSGRKIGSFTKLEGYKNIDKAIVIDQDPIGKTSRSNPATYVKVFDHIRNLFAELEESRAKGYKPGRFSFNVAGGRCEDCKGDGIKKIEMHFLPDVYVNCESCQGFRFNKETLAIKFKDKNIYDVLEMTVLEALNFFSSIPTIKEKLETLIEVGLDYVKLGQMSTTLSGGESQRIKLALELSKRETGNTFYILDEPTTGLHFEDIKKLLKVLNSLVEKGNSVLVIEHNLDFIANADYIIDLGKDGGDGGGELIYQGDLQGLLECKESYTGFYLKRHLENKEAQKK